MNKGEAIKTIVKDFSKLGYHVNYKLLLQQPIRNLLFWERCQKSGPHLGKMIPKPIHEDRKVQS